MSNLSLSFSFYFWWINSSQSVTLTNSLSQSVNVYPDVAPYWIGAKANNVETKAWATRPDTSPDIRKAPTLTKNLQNFVATQTGTTNTGDDIGMIAINEPINFSTISTLKIECNASVPNTTGWASVALDDLDNYADSPTVLAGKAIVNQRGAGTSFNGIMSLDVSNVSSQGYVAISLSAKQNTGPATVTVKRIWGE